MLQRFLISFLCVAFCALVSNGADTTTIGGITRVIDGDTLEVVGERVRLKGIDAPEMGQRCRNASGNLYFCGRAAAVALRERIGDGEVVCEIESQRDRYGRALGECYAGGEELNGWMVSEGYALAYRRYSMQYAEEEEEAKVGRRGVWAGEFVPPWRWRNGDRLQTAASSDDSSGTSNSERSGELDALAQYDDDRNGRITCREARRHDIIPVRRGHPAYPYMRDSDSDGVACE